MRDSDDDSITLNLNVSDDDTFCCPLPPGGKMKPTKQLLSDISKAVGEVVGIDHPVDKAPSFQTNTPLSEGAASLMGDWNMDEQVLISDENPHALDNLVCIEVHDEGQEGDQALYSGKFAILGDLPEGIGKLDTPLAPLPQRVQKSKPTTDSPTTGTKRALPFTTTPVKDTKGKKAAKQSASQPSSPTRAGRTSPMNSTNTPPSTVSLPTIGRVYSQEDVAQVVKAATLYRSMYEETKLQVQLLQNQLHTFTDTQRMANNEMMGRIVTLETGHSKMQTNQSVLESHMQDLNTKFNDMGIEIQELKKTTEELHTWQDGVQEEWMGYKQQLQDQSGGKEKEKDDDCSFLVGGLNGLREYYQTPQADPAQLIRNLLYDTWSYCTNERIVIADGAARNSGDRMQARAMIAVMRSPAHKKEAMIRIKRFLSQKKIKDVSINDCFPNDTLDTAKRLARYGAAQRRAGGIIRYRVVNKQGQAVLQTLKEGENFKDTQVPEAELANFGRPREQAMETDAQETTSQHPTAGCQ